MSAARLCPTKMPTKRRICPTKDVSDKKFKKIARYVRHNVSDKNEKMQDLSDRAICVDTITTSKRLEWLLNLLIPIRHRFY